MIDQKIERKMLSLKKSLVSLQSERVFRQLSQVPKRFKYVTETEVEHLAITTGRWPTRPNSPRVKYNPLFDPNDKSKVKSDDKKSRKEMISKAMSSYLESARQYDSFIKEQTNEFEVGKRHLANIMGTDANSMTQTDIDVSNY